jgi:putative inorganic carbon (HCO3(-)) transporter
VIEALFAVIAAAGLAVLFLRQDRRERLAALLAVAVGTIALGLDLARLDRVTNALTDHPPLAAAGIVLAVAGLLFGTWLGLCWPWLLPLFALAAAPIRVPVHLGGQEAFLLVPLYAVIACAWLVLVVELLRGQRQAIVGRFLGLPVALYLLLAAVSLAWSADTHQGAITTAFFLLPFGLLAVALARQPIDTGQLGWLLRVDVAGALLIALIGLAQWRTHRIIWHNPKLEISNLYAPFYRVSSIFYDPSVYGRFLAVAIALAAAALALQLTNRAIAVAVSLGVLWLGLVVSYSQSSFVALAAGLLACGAIVYGLRGLAVLVGCVVVLAAAGLAVPSVRAKLRSHSTSSITSDRSTLTGTGLRLAADHPIDGVGLGGFLQAAKGKRGNANARGAKGASHVMPITVAAELGLPGLILLGWMLAALAIAAVRRGPLHEHRLLLGIGLLVILVHSLFYTAFFEDPLMWGLLALLAATARQGMIEPA